MLQPWIVGNFNLGESMEVRGEWPAFWDCTSTSRGSDRITRRIGCFRFVAFEAEAVLALVDNRRDRPFVEACRLVVAYLLVGEFIERHRSASLRLPIPHIIARLSCTSVSSDGSSCSCSFLAN